ncbi:tetratricopeptide repeat protein [Cobetia marina]|uniref:tetratricopeptide repeat protein n=1 Tax=Cobetia marina TaxID=28258 RepID=UPI0038578E09
MVNRSLCSLFLLIFISCATQADILHQDNDTNSFDDDYSSFDYISLSTKENRTPVESYYLGIAYLRNYDHVLEAKNNCKAFENFEFAADNNIVDAIFVLGTMYYNGACVERDVDKAGELFIEAGSKGYVQAQALLARAYWGENTRDLFVTDLAEAKKWLKKAAENGDAPSAIGLAYFYEHGLAGDENPSLAFKWRLKASSLPYGEFSLGYFQPLGRYYEKGYGTEVDLIQAYKYYDLSGSIGGAGRSRLSKKMTNEQIAEARQQSRQWQEEHRHFNPGYNGLQRQSDGSYR